MANKDMTRFGGSAQKKVSRVLAVEVSPEFYGEAGDTLAAGTFNYLVAKLPANSVLTNAYLVVDEATTASTSAQAALGSAEGGAQVVTLTSVSTVGVVGGIVKKLPTGTGMAVYLQVKVVGTVTKVGTFTAVIEYTEYTKNSGEYTQF